MKLQNLHEGFGKYRTIYVDPPWPYRHHVRGRQAIEEVYAGGTMAEVELAGFPVHSLGSPEGFVVFCWAPWPKIRDGLPQRILKAWKLKWVSEIVWDKVSMGPGTWTRKQTEVLLVALPKGLLRPLVRNVRDHIQERRRRPHSTKPDAAYRVIERLAPGPRIELFARRHIAGWDCYGNECPAAPEPRRW
jgi:N6-adenosine-specific RNA methylase IME4